MSTVGSKRRCGNSIQCLVLSAPRATDRFRGHDGRDCGQAFRGFGRHPIRSQRNIFHQEETSSPARKDSTISSHGHSVTGPQCIFCLPPARKKNQLRLGLASDAAFSCHQFFEEVGGKSERHHPWNGPYFLIPKRQHTGGPSLNQTNTVSSFKQCTHNDYDDSALAVSTRNGPSPPKVVRVVGNQTTHVRKGFAPNMASPPRKHAATFSHISSPL